jgi:predicted transcriptional regulator
LYSIVIQKMTKFISKLDIHIITRIMLCLYDHGGIKKTNIARKTNMAYDNCKSYLDILELIELIKKEKIDNDFEIISLTQTGIRFCKKQLPDKFKIKEKIPQLK